MRDLSIKLKNKKFNYDKLLKYGFVKKNNLYIYKEKICNNQLEVIVSISKEKCISRVVDVLNNEDYILVDIEDSSGEFVGKVKSK